LQHVKKGFIPFNFAGALIQSAWDASANRETCTIHRLRAIHPRIWTRNTDNVEKPVAYRKIGVVVVAAAPSEEKLSGLHHLPAVTIDDHCAWNLAVASDTKGSQ